MLALGAVNAVMAGTVEGIVKDQAGKPLASANVLLVGTKFGGTTNLDGRYSITDVTPGIYSIRVIYPNYLQKVVAGVAVTGNETTTMDITLESASTGAGDAQRIDDTYVTADAVRSNIISLITQRQRSSVIGDGISAEQIRLSPDGAANDALKRVTGLSIVDDKFVFVRGVTDRYNSTTLNGTAVTSTDTDTDKKSFSFDMIPSSLIASTVVLKTAAPDLPGDFSGGLVQVNTLDFPQKFLLAGSVEAQNDEASSRRDIQASHGGGSDWKAKDDGSRGLPAGEQGVALAQSLPNTWGALGDRSRMNGSYLLALGDRFDLGGGEIGFVASGTYKNNYKVEEYHMSPEAAGVPIFSEDGDRYKHKYTWGGLANVSWRPSENHKISLENNFSRIGEDKVTQAKGVNENADSSRAQLIEWDQRDIYLGQVKGTHTLSFAKGLEIEWRASYSTSEAAEPDRKYAQYSRDPFGNYLLKDNFRMWSDLSEDTRGGQVDLELPLGDGTVKTGYLRTKREREYNMDAYTTDKSTVAPANRRALWYLPIDEIFASENYGEGKFGFIPYTDLAGDYDGDHTISSYYAMADQPFRIGDRNFRVAGGARVEDSKMEVSSPKSQEDATLQTSGIDNTDVLPSANLTMELTSTSNLRLGYFKSVNRPEFREMANVPYSDFDKKRIVFGNPELQRALIQNYDVRAEWFPHPSEVIAASFFYKDLTDAIEEVLIPSPGKFVQSWFNSPNGKNFGYELEMRKSLAFVNRSLENLVVQANYTHVDSEVEYTDAHTDPQGNAIIETKTRPLQGQAPYTVNAGLTWSMPDVGLSTSILYNKFGRRLATVGDSRDDDIYEEPRELLDFAVTEQFTSWMRLKFTVKDILSQDVVYTFGEDKSTWQSVKVGTTYALSLSFSL
jgi:outer membrane receptor for ferrienterochelin and colicin